MIRAAVTLGIVFLGIAVPLRVTAEARSAPIGIAPLDQDLTAMSQTLQRLEALINARNPDDLDALISPDVPGPRRQEMLSVVRRLVASLPADGRYMLRTDIGRGALVPVGPNRMQIQVRGTTIDGEERLGESVRLMLVPVELDGHRQWLLTAVEFPRMQSVSDVGGVAVEHLSAAGALGGVALAVALMIHLRRRRRQKQSDDT